MKIVRSIARKVFCAAIVVIIAVAGYNITLRVTHPQRFTDCVERNAAEYGVAPELIMAVIKCESSFDKEARSSAGAGGLMQLTEETFYDVRKMLGDDEEYTYETHWNNAEVNVRYGTKYLSYLLTMFDQDEMAALAAYNAGMGNVKNWIGSDEILQSSEIKFKETSDYVKRVLQAKKTYKKLYY